MTSAWASRAEVRQSLDDQLAKPLPGRSGAQATPHPDDPHDAERIRKYGPNPWAQDEAALQRAWAMTGG
ncbi:hypothetical protein [Frankia sp. AvcI1]|nr:hypothetical protein [Frankia sp. AvcI1]